jgi:hypothetical protein
MRPQNHPDQPVSAEPLHCLVEQRPGGARTPMIRMNVQGKHLANIGVSIAATDVDESDNLPVHLGDQNLGATRQATGQPRDPTFSSIPDRLTQEPRFEEVSEADPPRFRVCFANGSTVINSRLANDHHGQDPRTIGGGPTTTLPLDVRKRLRRRVHVALEASPPDAGRIGERSACGRRQRRPA